MDSFFLCLFIEIHIVVFTFYCFYFPGVVVASGLSKKRDESLDHILKSKDSLSGVALAGLTDGTEEANKIAANKLENILHSMGVSLSFLLLCRVSVTRKSFDLLRSCWIDVRAVGKSALVFTQTLVHYNMSCTAG